MQPKEYYLAKQGLYHDIVTHPDFDLGKRELAALDRILPIVARHAFGRINIVHLGVGDGREIPYFVRNFPTINTYIVNDISRPDLDEVVARGKVQFPHVNFQKAHADIEEPGIIADIREGLDGQTVIALVGNSVIFSNREVDHHVYEAMRNNDLFVVTVETPHEDMFRSYDIDPVYQFLSASGVEVRRDMRSMWYDLED